MRAKGVLSGMARLGHHPVTGAVSSRSRSRGTLACRLLGLRRGGALPPRRGAQLLDRQLRLDAGQVGPDGCAEVDEPLGGVVTYTYV